MFPILIVDDSREDLKLAERVFAQCRINNPVHLLTSGEECLDLLRKNYAPGANTKLPPCLILIDLAMTTMSGLQTIACINQLALSPPPWIVMLSGITDIKQIKQGYELGAKTFLFKPLSAEDLLQFIKSNERQIAMRMTAFGFELDW